jgi:hypothetical protein
MKKHETFLTSLARHTSDMRKLKLDNVDMLNHEDYFDDAIVDGCDGASSVMKP